MSIHLIHTVAAEPDVEADRPQVELGERAVVGQRQRFAVRLALDQARIIPGQQPHDAEGKRGEHKHHNQDEQGGNHEADRGTPRRSW
jgi:hypothetical protein